MLRWLLRKRRLDGIRRLQLRLWRPGRRDSLSKLQLWQLLLWRWAGRRKCGQPPYRSTVTGSSSGQLSLQVAPLLLQNQAPGGKGGEPVLLLLQNQAPEGRGIVG